MNPELALGTVQFGLGYGIAGRCEPVSSREVKKILARAWELGIRVIDTASTYGSIEKRFQSLAGDHSFNVISKIPAIPSNLSHAATEDYVCESIHNIRLHLGDRLSSLLFHNGLDLLGNNSDIIWQAAVGVLSNTSIRLGVSCYSPDEVKSILARYPITLAQIPGNALDQRIESATYLRDIEVHLRSVFLQGALLLSDDEIAVKLPHAMFEMMTWRQWCHEHELTPLQAALGIAKGLANVKYCVVGVDGLIGQVTR